MWALRRAGNPLRFRAQKVVSTRGCASLEVLLSTDVKNVEEHHEADCQKLCCCHKPKPPAFPLSFSSGQFAWSRGFSSQPGENSGDKDDELEDGFSDLEVPPEAGKNDAGLTSEDSSDEDAADEIGLPDVDDDAKPENEHIKKISGSILLKTVLQAPRHHLTSTLEKWAKDGNTLDKGDLYYVLLNLRKRRLYAIALEFVEWVQNSQLLELGERDYAGRVDLTAKVYGLHKAEQYIQKIPASHRGEVVYRTLLANCVAAANVKKSEEVFNRMKDLGFPVTTFSFNQLLLLYKRLDKKKIADVLAMMEKEDVKPSLFTYKLLVDAKGTVGDIEAMEKVVESMEKDGIEPDLTLKATIARHYGLVWMLPWPGLACQAAASDPRPPKSDAWDGCLAVELPGRQHPNSPYIFNGQREKAETLLESMEGDGIEENRGACKILLPLHAFMGNSDHVERIWKMCEDNARLDECLSAIEAFGKLGDVQKAEKVFEDMLVKWKSLSSRFYNSLLKVYADQNLLDKGKELVKRMDENNVKFGTHTLDALVKLYVDAGEVEKADSLLHKLSLKSHIKPNYISYIKLLDSYSKKGDVHNSEKVFNKLRQAGYTGRIRMYQLLLHSYLHAKTPAYGFKERMKADNIFPNSAVATLIAATDPFVRKKSISELLD